MKLFSRVSLVVVCLALLIISWVIVLGAKTSSEIQADLLARAAAYTKDDIYILAVPLLEEAAGYEAEHTAEAENALKEAYLQLIDKRGYRRKYTTLLENLLNKEDATPEIFIEAANFYLNTAKYNEAYTVLKDGIAKTGSDELVYIYENNRYRYKMGYDIYDDVTAMHDKTIGVSRDGLWGLAKTGGVLQIPCEYEKISTYSVDRVIVQKDGEIYAVDYYNNRISLLKAGGVSDFGNYADNRITLLTDDGWKRASGDFEVGAAAFEEIGAYSYGYAAAKENGKWGVIDRSMKWLIPAEYDQTIMDELGLSYAQGAAFVKKDDVVYLFADGEQKGDLYEDARPFSGEGYAAVKKNGKWGFIDASGEVKIACQFEDALSFGQHLAAVREDGLWGYINLEGKIVIDPVFLQAKSFEEGSAPVLTERGWRFISLLEYMKGVGL